MKNLATILPSKSKFPVKFKCFTGIDGSIEMLKINEFPKILVKMKNFKTSFRPKKLATWRKLFIPHQRKASYLSGKKISNGDLCEYTEICFPSPLAMQFLSVYK